MYKYCVGCSYVGSITPDFLGQKSGVRVRIGVKVRGQGSSIMDQGQGSGSKQGCQKKSSYTTNKIMVWPHQAMSERESDIAFLGSYYVLFTPSDSRRRCQATSLFNWLLYPVGQREIPSLSRSLGVTTPLWSSLTRAKAKVMWLHWFLILSSLPTTPSEIAFAFRLV